MTLEPKLGTTKSLRLTYRLILKLLEIFKKSIDSAHQATHTPYPPN